MDINDAWKSTCRALLNADIGDLKQYSAHLSRNIDRPVAKTSALSGKPVFIDSSSICGGAKFIANDEMEKYNAMMGEKLGIDEIKDLDSIRESLGGRLYYSGSIILGNSRNVSESHRCFDSSFVSNSYDIFNGRYVAFSSTVRLGECIFGSNGVGETKFCIGGYDTYKDTRCMEVARVFTSSDCYFSGNLEGCSNCMFSFNQRAKSRLIGNRELSAERYSELKAKLTGEIRETLKSRKSTPGILELIGGNDGDG
jgi:hypothetical protein